jgi:hypothetical protein
VPHSDDAEYFVDSLTLALFSYRVPQQMQIHAGRNGAQSLSYPALRYMLHTSGFEIQNIDTNRIKGISWLYAPIAIVQYLLTRLNIRKAKPEDINPRLSREVLSQMMTLPLLFGETMVVAATKKSNRR